MRVTFGAQARVRAGRPAQKDAATEAQELWFAATSQRWSTLALVPAHRGGSALHVAYTLIEAGTLFLRRQIELVSAEGIDIATATGWIFDAVARSAQPQPFAGQSGRAPERDHFQRIVVLEPVVSNPLGIALARAADAVLLVAELGVSDLGDARFTVEAIGQERFLGCVLAPTA